MSLDLSKLSDLPSLFPNSKPPAAALPALKELYDGIGPELPHDLDSTSHSSNLPGSPKLQTFNYDEGHAGRFSVPGNEDGASLSFEFVQKQPSPFSYVMSNIAFRSAATPEPSTQEEVTIFIPGLNTLHQPTKGEPTTMPERCAHYVRCAVTLPMAQLHIGTSFDQGDIRVRSNDAFEKIVLSPALPSAMRPKEKGDMLVWNGRQIDRMQATLSQFNIIDTPIKKCMRSMFDSTKNKDAPQFTIVVYSRGAIEAQAALQKYISEAVKHGERQDDVEKRLRAKLTIVTVGSATADYPDGPAYIHLASWKDTLSNTTGVTAKNNVSGAGKDAVFLNCDSPYHPDSFDNHNFGAVTAQYLGIMIAMNQAKGMRDLWEMAQRGEMKQPRDAEKVVRAMIQLTSGYKWLWSPKEAWKDVRYGALPDRGEAADILKKALGDDFVKRVVKNFDGW